MKVVTPKEQMEQRNLGYFTVAIKFCLTFSSHSHLSLEGNPLMSPGISWHKGHCYHHLPGWTFVLLQGNLWKTILNVHTTLYLRNRLQRGGAYENQWQGQTSPRWQGQPDRDSNWEAEREAETLSYGKHQFQMSLLQPKHSRNVECFLSWDEMFTCTAGSPRQRLILLECRSFCRFADRGLCVWVFTDLSWPDPGTSQPAGNQLTPKHLPWENIPAGKQRRGTIYS